MKFLLVACIQITLHQSEPIVLDYDLTGEACHRFIEMRDPWHMGLIMTAEVAGIRAPIWNAALECQIDDGGDF